MQSLVLLRTGKILLRLNKPIFFFSPFIIMNYNKELETESRTEYEMERKASLECVVPDCHFCSPLHVSIRPKRALELLTFDEYIEIHGLP